MQEEKSFLLGTRRWFIIHECSLYLSKTRKKTEAKIFLCDQDQWIYPSSEKSMDIMEIHGEIILIRFVDDNKLCQNKWLVQFTIQQKNQEGKHKFIQMMKLVFLWNSI